ncbi:MAG: hypothetical protein KTR24_03935, partial [Saprospiraceae bacterium]|nr:hypothetical protein [Saprospiraceae bacterium]
MKKISREAFLKASSFTIAAAVSPQHFLKKIFSSKYLLDNSMMTRLVEANDKSVKRIVQDLTSLVQRQYYRNLSESFSMLTAAFCHTKSTYYQSGQVVDALSEIMDKLLLLQYPNGTLDSGGNRKSPPDT